MQTQINRKVWGREYVHVGMYSMLKGDDQKLEGVSRIAKAGAVCTQVLLSWCFPPGSDGDTAHTDKCTLVDLGSGFGGTARVAARELGCKVRCL
ncbi:unnamed protein product, partial [Laminaria digitata]